MLCPLRLDVEPIVIGSPWLIPESMVKLHSHIDGADSDELLEVYLKAAITWAENSTHRTVFSRNHRWVLRDFPNGECSEMRLPRGKASAVSGITYTTGQAPAALRGPTSGSPAGADFQEDLTSDSGGVLMPPQGGSWPSVDYDAVAPVVVEFTAGWAPDEVPADFIHAILFAVEDMFDIRGTADFTPAMAAAGGPRFATREALISGYRLPRWYS